MNVEQLLRDAVQAGASDIFIVVGLPLAVKVQGELQRIAPEDANADPLQTQTLVEQIYVLANRDLRFLREEGDDDFAFSLRGVSRFRASTYRQRGTLAAVVRVVRFSLPDPTELGLPAVLNSLADRTKGMILVTGPAGSGKSTTLACMIDHINQTRAGHIITLEDPIEFLHSHRRSIVSQREVRLDTNSYVAALRASLRQAPDVILLGEMRDHETMAVAMTAAETGHLLLSTLHTVGAANAVDRIVDAFPTGQQAQIRVQLAQVLQAVISQQLIPAVGGGVAPAFEVMIVNVAIRNMIREAKTHQIETVIQSAAAEGMCTMDASLQALCEQGRILRRDALLYSLNPDALARRLGPA